MTVDGGVADGDALPVDDAAVGDVYDAGGVTCSANTTHEDGADEPMPASPGADLSNKLAEVSLGQQASPA